MPEPIRYSDIPFPPYRYIPGRTPHPTEHPEGHSFGMPEARERPPFDPSAWREEGLYLYGIDLYNAQYWWEAHEAFEELWRTLKIDEPARRFLQGLIKICAAFIQIEIGNKRGSGELSESALALVIRAPADIYLGIDDRAWVQELQAYFFVVFNTEPMGHLPEIYPRITLKL